MKVVGITMKKWLVTGLLVLGVCGLSQFLSSSEIIRHPRPGDKLEARWNWALENAGKLKPRHGYWIAYSIKKMMGEFTYFATTGTYMYSTSHPSSSLFRGKTLEEMVYGRRSVPEMSVEEQIKSIAKQALESRKSPRKPQRRVWKDVAILFKFKNSGSKTPETIRFTNMTVAFDPGERPVFWLDKSADAESFQFLSRMYAKAGREDLKKRYISAVGLHSSSDLIVSFLTKVVKSRESEKIRGRAASELGDHDTKASLAVLMDTARKDRSVYVRKRAVYGLEDLKQPEAVDGLIDLARNANHRDIRKAAISALGDIASEKAVSALEDFVYDDDDTEVQKRAVYALEDLPNNEGIPLLIKIARSHPKTKIRKSAIYCLGDSGDPRALETLISIIKKK